ncbi:MAG: hypothetical protein LQ347_001414 [Umbilicaria vellea]|nr:MAG: hypothetical protein LQ347_001414 [Umbilicaria vellea]
MSKRVVRDTEPSTFKYPRSYFFPPLFTLQPNTASRNAQFKKWSSLILSYCRHHRVWRLSIIDALDTPLFYNSELRKRLSLQDAREIVDWMTTREGSERAEWIGREGEKSIAWVYWRRPEEWAVVLADWDRVEPVRGPDLEPDFHGMEPDILQKSLNVLVKRGKAQVFGSEDQQGVKFF